MLGEKLPIKVKLGYGVCDLGGNLFFTVIAFLLLNYLTDTVGIAAGLAGTIIMVGKIWDAITDPVVGYMSDRTQTRWGRRRPYIFVGAFPLFLCMILMFTNPSLEGQMKLFIWGVIVYCLLNTAYTLVNIPYNSMTPELTQDFHERTSINGYRFGFAVVGTLLGAGAALPLVNAFSTKNLGYSVLGGVFGFLMLVTALITFLSVKESGTSQPPVDGGFFKTYLKVFKNGPYKLILLAYTLHITAITVASGIVIYYFKYIHHDEAQTTIAMMFLLVTAMFFIPVSVLLSKKIGKKLVYGSGMALFSIAVMIIFMFGHTTGVNFSFVMMFFAGIGMGFTYAMPYAIVPDAVEYDYLLTGERTEGAFYGIWTFGIKLGQALALAIMGAVLSLSGYVPDVAQSPSALLGIRMLMGPITAILFLLSIWVLYLYPINEKRYNEILEEIKNMDTASA